MIQQGCQHASSPYQPVFGILPTGGFFNPLHPSLNRQAQRIRYFPKNTKNPVNKKGFLPAPGRFYSRLQHTPIIQDIRAEHSQLYIDVFYTLVSPG